MAVNERIVKQRLQQVLRKVDFETETQRTITHRLEQELGVSLSEFKPLIKDEIDAFLTEQDDLDDDADSDFEPEPAAAPPPAKKQKAAGGGAAPAPPAGEFVAQLAPERFACVRRYGSRTMVDVREFYEKEGSFQPGRKGVALQAAAWDALQSQLGAISAALKAEDASFVVDLDGSKRASVSAYKGRHSVDIREWYSKDGEMMPGKKGIALSGEEWAKLCKAAPQLSQHLHAMGAAAPAPSPSPAAAASPVTEAGPSSGGPSDAAVELSGQRLADVSEFKGTIYCSIREYYEKDGQKLPGKKGISLPKEQFAVLNQHAAQLDAALKERRTDFEVPLSNKRKASVSCFKGRYMINIREFYEKDGQQLPGKKGISLPEDQWAKLLAGLPGLAQALDKA